MRAHEQRAVERGAGRPDHLLDRAGARREQRVVDRVVDGRVRARGLVVVQDAHVGPVEREQRDGAKNSARY